MRPSGYSRCAGASCPPPPALLVAALLFAAARPAGAVVRTCDPNPLASTADVLCAPPSGPCTDTLVVVAANLTMREGGCEFDLGGRALRIERTVRIPGYEFGGTLDGRLAFRNAGDVTISRRGKLKARGDFIRPAGDIVGGGVIVVESTGTIDDSGLLDVTGDGGGLIALSATGDIRLGPRSRTRGHGISSFRDAGARFADGGEVDLRSLAGSIRLQGQIALPGANQAEGGQMDLDAGRDIVLERAVDLSGGGGGGGELDAIAGDDVRILASIDASSRSGGEMGGDIFILAGVDSDATSEFVDAKPAGELEIRGATLDVRGSANANNSVGDGGSVDVSASGAVHVAPDVRIRADSAPNLPDGGGGYVAVASGEGVGGAVASDADLELGALVSARGTEIGGALALYAGRDLVVSGPVDLSGGYAGELIVRAARNATIAAPIRVAATRPEGFGGHVDLIAGQVELGTLAIVDDIIAPAGADGECIGIRAAACALSVDPLVTLDASCASVDGETPDGDIIRLLARDAIALGAGARFFAAPRGVVVTVHPPGVLPSIGTGAVFTPGYGDREDANAPYPACGG